MKTPSFHAAEILEDRIAPAGVVMTDYTEATGELKLTGDGAANIVDVFQTGPDTYRILGNATAIDGGAFRDIGKLTKLTILGEGDADTFRLINLRTLTALSYSGGDGVDSMTATNLSVKGAVDIHANGDLDTVAFGGLSTVIKGDLTIDTGAAVMDGIDVTLEAQTTSIAGNVFFTGGAVASQLAALADGPVTIGKGVKFIAGAGGATLNFFNDGLTSIGKLTTGESILFTGGIGDDSINFEGVDVKLASGIRMTGDAGADGVDFFNPTGTVKVGKLAGGESIFLDGGADADDVSVVSLNTTLAGGIDFVGADGSNEVALGANGGTIKVGKLKTGESIRFTGGIDDNSIFALSANLTLAGGIDMSTGAGSHDIALGGGKLLIGKLAGGQSIKLTGLGGDDTIGVAAASLTLAGGIEFAGGDGFNDVSLGFPDSIVKVGKLKTGQSILFNGGVDDDEILADVARITLDGGIEMNDGGGFNFVEMDDDGVVKIGKLAGGQSLKLTGTATAAFEVDLGGFVTLAGSLEATAVDGVIDVDFDGKVSAGKNAAGESVLINGGTAIDIIDFEDTITLAGSVKFNGGAEADVLNFNSTDSLTVKGGVEFIGGPGDDSFDIESSFLDIRGALTVTGGDDTDTARLVADGTIAGNANIDLGPAVAGTQTINLASLSGLPAGLIFKGSLMANSAMVAGFNDELTLTNISVAKLIDLKMGEGISTVTIDNLAAGDEFKLDTRDGADVVNIERGNFFGGSVIRKLAMIQLGLGDDMLLIGNPQPAVVALFPDHTRVNFLGGLNADGGGGAGDDRNDFGAQNDFGVALVLPVPGFELLTLV